VTSPVPIEKPARIASPTSRFEQGVQIGGERVVVVADGRLAGAPEPTAVVPDHAVAGAQQRALLVLPRGAVQGVPVDQHDRLTAAVVLVVDLDR
jgi:hypothetical protein